ncbi:MAG: toll/interleukin-1 receptor domain-containing protein [Gammaproteobacteria bacterium]
MALVAQTYLHAVGKDRVELELDVSDFYQTYADQTNEIHRDLASLPFQLCLTMTPESLMTKALQDAGKSPTSAWYNFTDPLRGPTVGECDQPIVYGLLGSVETPSSLVLAETDVLEYLVTVSRSVSGLPDYIAAQLADPKTTFLFLGFGFQRWYTRMLLHVLRIHGHNIRSLALEGDNFFNHQDAKRTIQFFDQTSWLDFRRESLGEFAAGLRQRFEQRFPSGPTTATNLVGAPRVFLCHDSRDRDLVVGFEQRLHALGVDTWRDEQQLRGGVDWDRRIERVLTQQVDYVVVCETPGMVTKGESYLHKELKIALDRQSQFPGNEGFIWPVTLKPAGQFAELSKLHRRDVTSGDGVNRLAKELLDDWAQRRMKAVGNASGIMRMIWRAVIAIPAHGRSPMMRLINACSSDVTRSWNV